MFHLLHTFLSIREVDDFPASDGLCIDLSISANRFSFIQFVVLQVDLSCVYLILSVAKVLSLFVLRSRLDLASSLFFLLALLSNLLFSGEPLFVFNIRTCFLDVLLYSFVGILQVFDSALE